MKRSLEVDTEDAKRLRLGGDADPRVIVDATAKMQAFQVSIGTLDKDVPLDGLFDASFYERATKK